MLLVPMWRSSSRVDPLLRFHLLIYVLGKSTVYVKERVELGLDCNAGCRILNSITNTLLRNSDFTVSAMLCRINFSEMSCENMDNS